MCWQRWYLAHLCLRCPDPGSGCLYFLFFGFLLCFLGYDQVTPPTFVRNPTYSLGENFNPSFLIFRRVCVEINDFAVAKTYAEAFLNKHISFFVLREARLSTGFARSTDIGVEESVPVVNKLRCFAEVDSGTRLSCCLVIRSQSWPYELEISSAPVLDLTVSSRLLHIITQVKLTGQSPPCCERFPSHVLFMVASASRNSRMAAFMLFGRSFC